MVVRASWVRESEILSAVENQAKLESASRQKGGAPPRAKFSHGIPHVISTVVGSVSVPRYLTYGTSFRY